MTKRLALAGCGAAKRDRAAPARELYTSNYFDLKRRFGERCSNWRVLSAEHGLVHPDTVLEPYDTVLTDLDADETEAWAVDVLSELRPLLSDVTEIVMLAGRAYSDPLRDDLANEGVRVSYPFDETGGIGEQMAWMKSEMPTAQEQAGLSSFA